MAMRYFCTLFDTGYSSRGLVMLESLESVLPQAVVYVLCMDEAIEGTIKALGNPRWIPIALRVLETPPLLAAKAGRTRAEYCWTNTSQILLYCLQNLGLPECTYVDADLQFFSDPSVVLQESPAASVLLTEHWYTPRYDQSALSGRFCVQFLFFRRDEFGMKALTWWAQACLDWCFARHEDGKFGDQKYLDDWPTRFSGVHIIQHRGIGVAPWNVQQVGWVHLVEGGPTKILVESRVFPLIFFHFHQVRLMKDGSAWLGSYELGRQTKERLYYPYLKSLGKAATRLRSSGATSDVHSLQSPPHPIRRLASWFRHRPTKCWNVEYRVPDRFFKKEQQTGISHQSADF